MLKNIFLLLTCVMLLATTSSCKKTCGLNCLHNGSCDATANACSCPDPYSGKNCDTMCTLGKEGYQCLTLSRDKFLGAWSCKATDPTGNSQTFNITFTANAYELWMNMNNFNNNSTYPVICTLVGKQKFSADAYNQPTQGIAAGLSGDGYMQNGQLIINMTINGTQYFCKATKQ